MHNRCSHDLLKPDTFVYETLAMLLSALYKVYDFNNRSLCADKCSSGICLSIEYPLIRLKKCSKFRLFA